MNWKPHIFKPKWQHKDPDIRREAVATEQDPELSDALGVICREDPDAGVREAAVRRLEDLDALSEALRRETDPGVGRCLQERLRQLTASTSEIRADLGQRLKVVEATEDRELLEAVASSAPEEALRLAALSKVDRQGFLGDRAIGDPSPKIRRAAADAITQHSTLRRVIEGSRKSDKALHQALSERLHAELLAAGDREAVDLEAIEICQAVEHAAIKASTADAEQIAAFRTRWSALGNHARPEHTDRFERDLARLARAEKNPEPAPEREEAHEEQVKPEEAPQAPAPETEAPASGILREVLQLIRDYAGKDPSRMRSGRLEELATRWNEAWQAVAEKVPADHDLSGEADRLLTKARGALEAVGQKRDSLLDSARGLVTQLASELENGELHKALESRLALQNLGKQLGGDRRWKSIQSEINAMQGKLRELRGWQHWSNNKIRKRMIKEMEMLPSSDLHPDAVLERIKELQATWKELEQSEQIPGDKHFAAAPWMWRKFNAAGRQAFEATKPFLDKRTEIQKRHLAAMQELSKRITDLAGAEAPDWKELGRALGKARREMRSLGEIPARARHRMAGRLKAALERGNEAMQGHYDEVEKRKLKLIREASQLAHAADRDEAISTAKSLQAEWTAAGSLWRSRENKLWREFREHLDPLFEDLKAARESAREERNALLADQKKLCGDLRDILKLDDEALPGQHGRIQGLRDQWGEIRHPDRRLHQDFQKLLGKYRDRLVDQERRAEQATRNRWIEKSDLLHKAEAAAVSDKLDDELKASLNDSWPAAESAEELDTLLDGRFEAAMGGAAPAGTDRKQTVEAARKRCICLEFLAGIPSPDKEKDLRMQYQVDRLSESMSGERQRMSALDEARQLEAEWLAMPFMPDRDYRSFRKRVQIAMEEIISDK